VFRILFSIILLQRGPEDVPASLRLLQEVILLNLLTGVVVLSAHYDMGISVSSTLLDLAVSLAFTGLLLLTLNRRPRFVQTAAAICGTGAIFHLVSWPFLIVAEDAGQSLQNTLWILMLLLTSWELMVVAHIFRRAIDSGMASAIALSFALFMISITVSQLIFPGAQ
jgi:hypothetical protein